MMRFTTIIFMAMSLILLVNSNPLPENEGLQSKELDSLVMIESDNDTAQRSKRTIGILRQLFPQVSKMIEDKVNKIVGEVIKALGPAVLRGALGAQRNMKKNNENNVKNKGGETVTVPLPSFDDEDDEDDEDLPSITNDISTGIKTATATATTTTTTATTTNDRKTGTVSLSLDEITTDDQSKTSSTSSTTTTIVPNVNPETENQVQQETNNEAAGSENNEVRVQFEDSANEALEPLAPLDDVEVSEDDNRNKRFLSFGGNNGGPGGGGGSGSGGGSGNFLFDIIRLVAGSGSAGTSSGGGGGGGSSASASTGTDSQAKGSDATEAVPGPVTRLLVIANRGISNLLQDLILRLAATSERIVNFKARLITSII